MNFLSEKTTLILPDFVGLASSNSNTDEQTNNNDSRMITNGNRIHPQSNQDNSHLRVSQDSSTVPSIKHLSNSPMVKRSRFERDKCQKIAHENKMKPTQWSYCLLSNVYALWFMHLPTMIECYTSPRDILNYAYKVLVQMNRQHLTNPDEICFRVLIQLCGSYNYPILAVKTYSFMKKTGVEWNAVTYGAYNKAVYEGTWERHDRWATLRSVVHAVWAFKNARRYRQNQRHHHASSSSLEDDDSDGAMSVDSGAASSTSSCVPMPTSQSTNRNIDSNDNLKDNRTYSTAQDDTFTSVLSTLAETFKDFTESPYFPKMTFKKIPSIDGPTENRILKTSNINSNNNGSILEAPEKRSLWNILDMPAKLDFSALRFIAHQTARSDAGILMTCSDIEIGDIGMLSYRLPVAPVSQLINQHQVPRRSYSCMSNQEKSNAPVKWELTSRTQVLTNDPLGLLNPAPSTASPSLPVQRTSSLLSKPFANSSSSSTEVKPSANVTQKEEESSSLLTIPTSITQLRAKLNQTGISALYNAKNLNTIKSFALDRLSDLKTTVKSGTIPLTQSKSLYAVKNPTLNKERQSAAHNGNGKLRGSHSSLVSQQSSNSSTLNTNYFNGSDINHLNEDIKALKLDPTSVAIPIGSSDDNSTNPKRIVEISSCNRCSVCNRFLYDEEIMAGWSSDDSELHTICAHCGEKTVPNLSIQIRDIGMPSSQSSTNNEDSPAATPTNNSTHQNMIDKMKQSIRLRSSSSPITVHYLSPLVLRKELENIIDNPDSSTNHLHHVEFIEKHPILFWNLIWFYRRIRVASHLFQMLLRSLSLTIAPEGTVMNNLNEDKCVLGQELVNNHSSIHIRCLWDSVMSFNDIAEPMYKTWEHDGYLGGGHTFAANALITDEHSTVTGKVIRDIVSSIEQDDLDNPVKLFIKESSKSIRRRFRRRSMYREILFLAIAALGREKISYDAFDRKYNKVFENLNGQQRQLVSEFDKCPSLAAVMCRRLFSALEL